jgi:hypothetical protein
MQIENEKSGKANSVQPAIKEESTVVNEDKKENTAAEVVAGVTLGRLNLFTAVNPPPATIVTISAALRAEIDQAYVTLNAEKKAIQNSCFFFLRRTQHAVKELKLQKLNQLRDPQISLAAVCVIAQAALQNRVIISGRRSRTKRILQDVINEQRATPSELMSAQESRRNTGVN